MVDTKGIRGLLANRIRDAAHLVRYGSRDSGGRASSQSASKKREGSWGRNRVLLSKPGSDRNWLFLPLINFGSGLSILLNNATPVLFISDFDLDPQRPTAKMTFV
jgi:hypothetical protein